MKFVAARCPSCNGELQVPEDKDFIKCMYCGIDVKVREAITINMTGNTVNYMELASNSMNSGNYEESYNYFTKTLEFEIKNYKAWFGKAISAAKLSTLANPRLKEMLNCFDCAIKYNDKDDIDNYKINISNKVMDVCTDLWEVAKNHKDNFITVDSAFPEYISQCSEIIDTLEYACNSYKSNDSRIYKLLIDLCLDNIEGTEYTVEESIDDDYRQVKRKKSINDKYRTILLKKIYNTRIAMRKANPEYWNKHDAWVTEVNHINKMNLRKSIIYALLFFPIGFIPGILLIPSEGILFIPSEDIILAILISLPISILGFAIGMRKRIQLPPEPKEYNSTNNG